MGTIAARKAARSLENLEKIVAIELMLGARAHEVLLPLRTGPALRPVVDAVCGCMQPLDGDRCFVEDFEAVLRLVQTGGPDEE